MAAGQTDPARDRRILQPDCGTSSESPLTRGAFLRVHAPTPIKDAPNQPAAQVPLPGEHVSECHRWTHSCEYGGICAPAVRTRLFGNQISGGAETTQSDMEGR